MHKKEEVNETKSISDLFKTSKSESDSKNQKGFENVFEIANVNDFNLFFSYFSFGSKSASELQKTSDNHCIIAIHDVKVDSGNRVFTNVQLSL